ncbi:DNA polymerase delta subunit 4-like [Ananas comosus]|uniref:DNA polymerase delta subunit 4-like n=1 Tax=Ananas comosus TaxID=4615 RepID=A0A6P5ET49_ANACO|nr:DNA polymerase delta subunit 4-like [Ananas comosus]
MASKDIKGFYRQTKKKGGGGKAKAKDKAAPSNSKKKEWGGKHTGGASVGAPDPAQTPALIAHGSLDLVDDYGEEEERLRQFDMDMRYGPCIGLGRLQRWERAAAMGLNPPPDVARILQRPSAALECLWDGRV